MELCKKCKKQYIHAKHLCRKCYDKQRRKERDV
jgi:hypothetical protein